MAGPEAGGKVTVRPGMVQVQVRIVRSGMSDPLIVSVNVRRVRMTFGVAKVMRLRGRRSPMRLASPLHFTASNGPMRRNVSAAGSAMFSAMLLLSTGSLHEASHRKHQTNC